jgi:hypothetical protein
MNKISISAAARLAGISRTNLYKTYINAGKISVIREDDKVYIDTSELIRVFPNCKLNSTSNEQELSCKDDILTHDNSEIVELLKTQLAEAKDREDWLKQQINELRQQQGNLLEDKTAKNRKKFLGIF